MLKKINMSKFRNFIGRDLTFSPETSVIIGPNASGKTNVLEGIYLLSSGKSFRARVEEEMINYDSDLARISAIVNKDNGLTLEAVLTRGEIEVGRNRYEKTPRKKLLVNGISRRLIDFAGNFKVVLFGPWDMDLVTESPSLRRKFLDNVLSQVDREYRRASLSYEKGLRQRNRLLLRIREEGMSRSQLLFWDRLLIKNGDYISRQRESFINYVNSENVRLSHSEFQLEYDRSVISESRLEQYAAEEVAAATTLVGPHRDDFSFYTKSKNSKQRDLSRFGSRGEQRMGILWLKMCELDYIKDKSGDKPTLLLDDIFSELDHDHRKIVMQLSGNQQTIITTADKHFIEDHKNLDEININLS